MKSKIFFILVLGLAIASLQFINADVGVGISPSKAVEQIEGGQEREIEFLVFNTGTDDIFITLSVAGDIAKFVTIEKVSDTISPEPIPHKLPIKNGKVFLVKLSPPATSNEKTYEGTISAIGSPSASSQFGGSVGVASQVQIIVTPTKTFLSYLTITHYIIIAAIVVMAFLIWFLRRAGFKVSFKGKRRK
jgi:hypothetical protein